MIQANIIGNLASDPETRGDFVEITVASNPQGAKAQERYATSYVRATFKTGTMSATMAGECKKGQKVAVGGKMLRREYVGKDGKAGVSLEIPFVDYFEKCFPNPKPGSDAVADPFGG